MCYIRFYHPHLTHQQRRGREYLEAGLVSRATESFNGDVINWKHFPHYSLFVREIQRSLVNSPQKGQWRGALLFSLICAWTNGWVNNRDAGDLTRHCAHYDVTVTFNQSWCSIQYIFMRKIRRTKIFLCILRDIHRCCRFQIGYKGLSISCFWNSTCRDSLSVILNSFILFNQRNWKSPIAKLVPIKRI